MIKGFDGIRALAVIVVFFNHWTAFGRDYHTGDYGVWTFFVLSGFLIIRALHRDRIRVEKGASAKSAILEFYGRRALRIFPVYYATLLARDAGFARPSAAELGFSERACRTTPTRPTSISA